jgi:hypothetical protein
MKGRKLTAKEKADVERYTHELINGVLDFYKWGDAVDCPETRKKINKELESVMPRVCEKFRTKLVSNRQLRAVSDGKGFLTVRMIDTTLN